MAYKENRPSYPVFAVYKDGSIDSPCIGCASIDACIKDKIERKLYDIKSLIKSKPSFFYTMSISETCDKAKEFVNKLSKND